jgi:hypothetical protein
MKTHALANSRAAAVAVLVMCAALLFAPAARAQDQAPEPGFATQPLHALTSGLAAANPAAAGSWSYDMRSADASLGRLTVTLSVQPCTAGECYVLAQSGRFEFSATDTRLISSRAVLKPDFTLLSYEKSQQSAGGGQSAARAAVGGLTVTVEASETGAAPMEKTIRKTGPVFFAPAATFLLVRAANPEKNTSYIFDSLSPEQAALLPGYIQTLGPVTQKTGQGAQTLFRLRASNGESVLLFDVNASGEIARYGPETGDLEFVLVK